MIAHICYENKNYSRKIAKICLRGVCSKDEIHQVIAILKWYLSIDDSLFMQRITWVLGYSEVCINVETKTNNNYYMVS